MWRERSLDAEAVDLLGIETDEGVAEPGTKFRTAGRERFCTSANLEHARSPGVGRHEIVDNDRSPGARLNVAVPLRRRDMKPAYVNGAEIAVVAKGGRYDVGFAVSTRGCD